MNYLEKNKQLILNFLVLFFPLTFLLGKVIVELFLVLMTTYAFFNIKKFKKYLLQKNFIVILLLFFYIVVFISTINNIDVLSKTTDQNLLLKSIANLRFVIYIISILYILDNIIFKKNFFIITLIVYIIFLADGYVEFLIGENLLGYSNNSNRIAGIFKDEFIFGSYIQKVFPILFLFHLLIYKFKLNKKNFIFLSFVLILSTVIISLSGDRSALLLFILYLFLNTLIMKGLRKFFLLNFLISGIIISLLFFFQIGKNLETLNQRYNPSSNYNKYHSAQISNNKSYLRYISADHLGHFLVVKEMVKDNFIIGKGYKSFRFMCRGKLGNFYPVEKGICSTHPHNYYLQSLSSAGIIGFILLSSIFLFFFHKIYYFLFNIFKNKKKINLIFASSTICMFIYFWPLIPTGNFFSNWISGFNCFAIAMFIFIKSKFNIQVTK